MEFAKTMLRSLKFQTFRIAKNMNQNTKWSDIKYYQSTRPKFNLSKIRRSRSKTRMTIVASAGFICKSWQFSPKFIFDHLCISLIMTNLHADRTKSPYSRCYALRAFLKIMAPNFKLVSLYNLQVDTKVNSCVLSTNSVYL